MAVGVCSGVDLAAIRVPDGCGLRNHVSGPQHGPDRPIDTGAVAASVSGCPLALINP
jgi:hypothetical protein